MYSEKIPNQKGSAGDESLMIGSPGSIYEKEAEETSMKVIHGDQLMGNANTSKDQIGAGTQKEGMIASEYIREGVNATKGGGDPLPADMKKSMKGVSGGELNEVKIHTDSKAAEMSKAINAKAFTIGKDIYFGQGKFDTYTSEGKQLLAHELTH